MSIELARDDISYLVLEPTHTQALESLLEPNSNSWSEGAAQLKPTQATQVTECMRKH